MKSLIRPFVILIVLSLSALSFALKTEDGVVTPGSQRDKTTSFTDLTSKKEEKEFLKNFYNQYNQGNYDLNKALVDKTLWSTHVSPPDTTIPVVVIPAALGGIEQISLLFNAAVRDLNIMCRLFDNQLKLARPVSTDPFSNIYYYPSDRYLDPLRSFWGRKTRNTNCIYIEGYGALFLMRVNIPLIAPLQLVKPKKKPPKPIDKVWRKTEGELYGSRSVPTDQLGKGYDTDTVEELKTNIVKTLRHAANIKCLKSDELVIVTMNGNQKKAGPPGVLIVRAKKSDIDAFSKGALDLDRFREKVHIVAPPLSKRASGPEQATGEPDTSEGAEE